MSPRHSCRDRKRHFGGLPIAANDTGLVSGAVLCEAVYTLLGKGMAEEISPLVVAFLAAMSVPLFLPFAWWQGLRFDLGDVGVESWMALGCYGAATLALGSWL